MFPNLCIDDAVFFDIICRSARIEPSMHHALAQWAMFVLNTASPRRGREESTGSGESTCRANQKQRMCYADGPFVCVQLCRGVEFVAQEVIDARLTFLKHVNFLWYILSSRWRVVIREASNPPWAGRRGGNAWWRRASRPPFSDRRVAL